MKIYFRVSLLALLGVCLFLTSCSQREVEREEPLVAPTPGLKAKVEPPVERMESFELKKAFFDYDKSYLRADARKIIAENMKWLKKNPTANVQLEGHCDERGSDEYNFNLGEKRAEAVKSALVRSGIDASRISTVSYGRAPGRGEKAWARARKVEFVVVYTR